jgi:hypothetical protein
MSVSIRCEQGTQDNSLDVWLGRLAMVGFAVAITVEIATGKGLLEVWYLLWVCRSKQKLFTFNFMHNLVSALVVVLRRWDTTCSFIQNRINRNTKVLKSLRNQNDYNFLYVLHLVIPVYQMLQKFTQCAMVLFITEARKILL